MDVNELMTVDRPLTVEEMAFMEEELLKVAKAFQSEIEKICAGVSEQDPVAAEELRGSANRLVQNIEAAAAIPLVDDRSREA